MIALGDVLPLDRAPCDGVRNGEPANGVIGSWTGRCLQLSDPAVMAELKGALGEQRYSLTKGQVWSKYDGIQYAGWASGVGVFDQLVATVDGVYVPTVAGVATLLRTRGCDLQGVCQLYPRLSKPFADSAGSWFTGVVLGAPNVSQDETPPPVDPGDEVQPIPYSPRKNNNVWIAVGVMSALAITGLVVYARSKKR